MNEYQLGLALVTELDESQKGLDERVEFIKSQIKIFNEKSLRSVFNPKHIGLGENDEKDIQLTRTTLVVTLYSQEALNTPRKSHAAAQSAAGYIRQSGQPVRFGLE